MKLSTVLYVTAIATLGLALVTFLLNLCIAGGLQ